MVVTLAAYDHTSSNNSSVTVQTIHMTMAISNELSSEIAAALLVTNKSPQDLKKLKEVLLEIHSTLQKMSEGEHLSRLSSVSITSPAPAKDSNSH